MIEERDSGKHNTAENSLRQFAVMNGLLLAIAGTKKNAKRSSAHAAGRSAEPAGAKNALQQRPWTVLQIE
jgi:hypothetical protein